LVVKKIEQDLFYVFTLAIVVLMCVEKKEEEAKENMDVVMTGE